MSRITDYHLAELRIALDPTHPSHINPEIAPHEEVLDIGCGAGQTLIATCPGRLTFGLDIDMESLRFGRTLTQDVAFVCGSAEQLPFTPGRFDVVISRVTLLYTDLHTSLAEIHRVLKPGGRAWLTLHSIRRPLGLARRADTWKSWLYFLYVVANSMLFHFFQKQFRFRGKRMESFQTVRGIRRALQIRGFTDIKTEKNRHFLVIAHKLK